MTINNNNIFGAFTLNEARGSRLTGDWLNKEFVANYGWFGGGGTLLSIVDRIDFSNESSTLTRGSLSGGRGYLTATGNSNYGWFGGGLTPGTVVYSTVDRIDFSNDSSTASVRGPLFQARTRLAATGNSNYGWFGGGLIPATPASVSTVDRIDFSNDSSTASLRSPLSLTRYSMAATGNSNYGWWSGGTTPGNVSTVDRIDFSNDSSTASPRGPLSAARYRLAATGNSNYGWFGGGRTPNTSTVDRIDFSNDSSTASVRGPLSSVRYNLGAAGNSNYGWFGGGQTPTTLSTIDRIDFSNDTSTASLRTITLNAPAGRQDPAATSGVLNIRRQKAGNYGWFGGGQNPSLTAYYSTVDRIDFSNDLATASPRSVLNLSSPGVYRFSATGNSNYGWFGGGTHPSLGLPYSIVNRIDFSNDSATSSRGFIRIKDSLAATGNSNYGWFGGGNPGVPASATVDRIDFSNDASTASSRGQLNSGRALLAATGNSNYGWFGGGFPSLTTVERINFANDLATASARGQLSSGIEISATGNSNYGWFGSFTLSRIDFSNDSVAAPSRGQLSQGRNRPTATGNSNYGWWGGGYYFTPPASVTVSAIVDRINFANDLATASLRGPLSLARQELAATSNTTR